VIKKRKKKPPAQENLRDVYLEIEEMIEEDKVVK
jgi:hypothetical protein